MVLNISIKDFLGIAEDGIVCLISLNYMEDVYESILWFDEIGNSEFTPSNDFLEKIGKAGEEEEIYKKDLYPIINNRCKEIIREYSGDKYKVLRNKLRYNQL